MMMMMMKKKTKIEFKNEKRIDGFIKRRCLHYPSINSSSVIYVLLNITRVAHLNRACYHVAVCHKNLRRRRPNSQTNTITERR